MKGGIGVPKVYWFGSKDDFNILIMELLGPSLQDFLKFCWNRFSLKTVLMLAKQARMIKFTPKTSGNFKKLKLEFYDFDSRSQSSICDTEYSDIQTLLL